MTQRKLVLALERDWGCVSLSFSFSFFSLFLFLFLFLLSFFFLEALHFSAASAMTLSTDMLPKGLACAVQVLEAFVGLVMTAIFMCVTSGHMTGRVINHVRYHVCRCWRAYL